MNRPRRDRAVLGPDGKPRRRIRQVRPASFLERRPLNLRERWRVRLELVWHRYLAWRASRSIVAASRRAQRDIEAAMERSRGRDGDYGEP